MKYCSVNVKRSQSTVKAFLHIASHYRMDGFDGPTVKYARLIHCAIQDQSFGCSILMYDFHFLISIGKKCCNVFTALY